MHELVAKSSTLYPINKIKHNVRLKVKECFKKSTVKYYWGINPIFKETKYKSKFRQKYINRN
jgi:hypothetical protein